MRFQCGRLERSARSSKACSLWLRIRAMRGLHFLECVLSPFLLNWRSGLECYARQEGVVWPG